MKQEVPLVEARAIVAQKAKQFEAALKSEPASGRYNPVGFDPWMAAVIADLQRQPKLREAAVQAPETIWDCLSVAANCGLLPGTSMGQFNLIPRWSTSRRRMECTFIVGYRGYCDMAYRHPRVVSIHAANVYRGEDFHYNQGTGELRHVWSFESSREDKDLLGAYCRVDLAVGDGSHPADGAHPVIMMLGRKQLEEARDMSDGYKAFIAGKIQSTPWSEHFAAQCRKTALRRCLNSGMVPRSNQVVMAITAETREEVRAAELQTAAAASEAKPTLRGALGIEAAPEGVEIKLQTPERDPIDAEYWAEADRLDREA